MFEQIEELIEVIKKAFVTLADDTELTDAVAKFTWNLYKSFCYQGFSSEDAVKMVVAILGKKA